MFKSIKNHILCPYYIYKLSDVIMEFDNPLVVDVDTEVCLSILEINKGKVKLLILTKKGTDTIKIKLSMLKFKAIKQLYKKVKK